jgi:hypothetical protein
MCRGNRKEEIFRDHLDREPFLRTLGKRMGDRKFRHGNSYECVSCGEDVSGREPCGSQAVEEGFAGFNNLTH